MYQIQFPALGRHKNHPKKVNLMQTDQNWGGGPHVVDFLQNKYNLLIKELLQIINNLND